MIGYGTIFWFKPMSKLKNIRLETHLAYLNFVKIHLEKTSLRKGNKNVALDKCPDNGQSLDY